MSSKEEVSQLDMSLLNFTAPLVVVGPRYETFEVSELVKSPTLFLQANIHFDNKRQQSTKFSNTFTQCFHNYILLTIEQTKHFLHLTNIPLGDISSKTRGVAECLV